MEEERGGDYGTFSTDGASTELTGDDIEAELRARDPQLQLRAGPELDSPGNSFTAGGLHLTGARAVATSVVAVVALGMLLSLVMSGPEPWRATRWGWFWFLFSPIGILAFCLLSGPTPGLRPPAGRWRLTGGVGCVLAFVLVSASRSLLPLLAALVLPGH